MITQFYFHPDLVVASSERTADKLQPFISYRVTNAGRAAATKIEIGFLLAAEQKIRLTPAIAANIVHEEQAAAARFVRVEVERLSARESFTVIISGPAPAYAKAESGFKLLGLPSFSFVRSAEGPGRYAPAPGEKSYWLFKGLLN